MTVLAVCASRITGKERDTESGNDYFGARYYGSNMGRFMSPDWAAKPQAVPYSSLGNPQSLNLYAYVGNNPLRAVDVDDHSELDGNPWLAGYDLPMHPAATGILSVSGVVASPKNLSEKAD